MLDLGIGRAISDLHQITGNFRAMQIAVIFNQQIMLGAVLYISEKIFNRGAVRL